MKVRRFIGASAIIFNATSGLLWPLAAHAEAPTIVISEIQVASKASASDEFVELYNPAAEPLDISGFTLEYRSASSSAGANCDAGWTKKSTIAKLVIPAGGFAFMGTPTVAGADAPLASGLASAGTIRLLDSEHAMVDAVAWGKSACGLGVPALAPGAGQSIERRPGSEHESGGNAYDTSDNATDFMVRAAAQPQNLSSPVEAPIVGYEPKATAPSVGGSGSTPDEAPALEINELLPDPASPGTDAQDEFIEFFNPSDQPVNLAGYVVKSGSSLSTKHTLSAHVIAPGGYLAVFSGWTKIALSNSGSSLALFSPSGAQVGPTITYPKAKTGTAWARFDDTWRWTTTPTASEPNVLSEPEAAVAGAATAASKAKTASKASAKAASSIKKTTKATTTKAKTKLAQAPAALAGATSTGGRWLLFALAGLTIAYIIYEFRHDVRNIFQKLRRHQIPRPATVQVAAWRGSDRARQRLGRG